MADNFNLKGYLKKNTLLNENVGGYRDIQPMREEIGTAMGEESMIFSKGWQYDDDEDTQDTFWDVAQQVDLEKALSTIKSAGISVDDVCGFIQMHWHRL